ncbi:MAG: class I SAM-dependent methyltransferase [Demequinaceae bacterium]|nr:class I SAM-dependent methyltransferase [Demequinaceae bacterium]
MRDIPVRVELTPGGAWGQEVFGTGREGEAPAIEIVRPGAFFARLGHQPKIGFGEAYMAGDWRPAPGVDLSDALVPFAAHLATAASGTLQRLRTFVEKRVPRRHRNTLRGSRRNIEAHYDLSNDLFQAFLDPSLTYSSALFDDSRPWSEQSLEEAQLRKVDAALDRAGVGEGTRLLEIGTGWGTLATRAAQRGARVTTLTLSKEQAALAADRARAAGVDDRIDLRLQDYREVEGQYDAIVSIEMIEAVGDQYWQTYFSAIDRLLTPGGTAVVQAILMSHDRYLATRRSFSWIQKHIFPGGIIPSMQAIERCVGRTSMEITDRHHFGSSYAETLLRWRRTFDANWERIREFGFDDEFKRMWEFYLAYSRSGFMTGYLDVAQVRMTKEAAE